MSALSGLIVLDLSRVLAGPWSTQNLADLGATVVKVERPESGDDTRGWGPPFLPEGSQRGDASYFLAANRGKQSITVDIACREGAEIVKKLAAQADVLVENYKVGGLKKYGLDYDSLKAINPRLIYCSITGFGQDGPYASHPGYDFLLQGMGGMMSVTGERDNLPGGGPQKAGIAVVDLATGLYATIAMLAAVNQRHATGEGQHIDIALLDVQVAIMSNQALQYLVSGEIPVRLGNEHHSIVPYQSFPTRDGHLIVAVGNDGQFGRLADELGHPQWAQDGRFVSNADRVHHREELITLIEAQTRKRTTADLMQGLKGKGVPCGPINDLKQTFNDPQVVARKMQRSIMREGLAVPTVASPLRMSASPVAYDKPPPRLGEHTRSVLSWFLEMNTPDIEALDRMGVI